MELYPILGSNNTVAQIDNPPYLSHDALAGYNKG